MAVTAGTRLGPYEVAGPLGAGGMGEVYRARDTRLGRDVALKVLPADVAHDADRRARFEREARAVAALSHPNILALFDIGLDADTLFVVTELLDGETLADRLRQGALPVRKAVEIAVGVARGLSAAHGKGIAHRDLKPANIFLLADGQVKVLDFGLAREIVSETGATQTQAALTDPGTVLGTAGYMAPEQIRGQQVDGRADLFALGVVLYEMLTGTRAFARETTAETLTAILKEDPPDLTTARADLPPALDRIVRHALEKNPAERFQSARDVIFALEAPAGSSTAVRATIAAGGGLKSLLSARLAWSVAAVALVAVVGAYFLGSAASREPTTPPPVTRLTIPAPPGTQIVSGHREIAVSRDGRQVAFIARGDADQHIYVRRLDELDSRQIAGTEGARDLALSPDGRWLAFHSGDKIRKVSIDGGTPSVLADAVHAHGLAWHPADDAIYFAPNQLSGIWKVPAAGGTAVAVAVTTLDTARGEHSHEWPVFSSDGGTLVFSVNPSTALFDEAEVSVLMLSTNVRETVRVGGGAFAFLDGHDLLFVRKRSVMTLPLSPPSQQLVPEAQALIGGVRESSGGNGGVVGLSDSGTLAYVPSPDVKQRSLVWISPDGAEVDAHFGRRELVTAALSGDGQRLAMSIGDGPDSGLYVGDAAGGTLTLLAKPGGWDLSWSPDGKWIAGSVHLVGTNVLGRVSTSGGQDWEPLLVNEWQNRVAQWTADGGAILFSRRQPVTGFRTISRLALTNAADKLSVIVDGGLSNNVQYPSLSPDGRSLAYESNESGRAEIYVQGYPIPSGRLKVSGNGGTIPRWAGNGRLYFLDGSALMVSAVTTTPRLQADSPRRILSEPLLLQDGRPFDVAPDGRILAIKEDDSVRSDHIIVVQNWLSEARAVMAPRK